MNKNDLNIYIELLERDANNYLIQMTNMTMFYDVIFTFSSIWLVDYYQCCHSYELEAAKLDWEFSC